MRNEGYYWAKYKGKWIIAEYDDGEWFTCGSRMIFFEDAYFDEIDENQITREPKEELLPGCSSQEKCNYTGECQESFTGGSCRHSTYNNNLKP